MALLTAYFIYDLLVFIGTVAIVGISYLKWKLMYWDRIGVPTLNPTLPFGDCKNILFGNQNMSEFFRNVYNNTKAKGLKHVGLYIGPKPCYVTIDPEIIKHIMQIDFQHFVNHGSYADEENDPLSAHLFSLRDAKWRNMRIKLTPTFTSGKMKMMFQTLVDCTIGLTAVMDEFALKKETVDIRDILARFTTDIIGSVAFGIECNSLSEPDNEFRKYGKKVFSPTFTQLLKGLLQFFLPERVLKALKYKITDNDLESFFLKIVRDTVDYREKNNIFRKDFMHLLIQLKNQGYIPQENKSEDINETTETHTLTINEIAAQCFVFFIAGFETSSTTMTFALYELTTNPDIQEKLRQEICQVLDKHDNKLTYDAIKEMTYMDQVLNETLRKYPPLGVLQRECNKDYKIPGTDIWLEKGVMVMISALGLHRDPEYFPNPEIFNPERFSEENKQSIIPYTWLPFGEGPRICIGLRFGLMQSKVGLVTLLKNYKLTLNKKTKTPLSFKKTSFITTVDGDVWLDVEKLNKN